MGTITINNSGKSYKQYSTGWSRVREWLVPFGKPRHQLKWVSQDINFNANSGETVGINGADAVCMHQADMGIAWDGVLTASWDYFRYNRV